MKLTQEEINQNLQEIEKASSLVFKHLKLAFLVAKLFKEEGYSIVVYGGAAVEQYTNGGYSTGDLDIGYLETERPIPEVLERVFSKLASPYRGRVRVVAGIVIDVGGRAEMLAKEPLFEIKESDEKNAFVLYLERPEEALLSRVIQGTYPVKMEDQLDAAKMLIAQALEGNIPFDWGEMERLCKIPGCQVKPVLDELVEEVKKLKS